MSWWTVYWELREGLQLEVPLRMRLVPLDRLQDHIPPCRVIRLDGSHLQPFPIRQLDDQVG